MKQSQLSKIYTVNLPGGVRLINRITGVLYGKFYTVFCTTFKIGEIRIFVRTKTHSLGGTPNTP